MRRPTTGSIWCAALAAMAILSTSVHAQDATGFRFGFGWQDVGGDVGSVLDGGVDAEFSVLVPVMGFRVGAGANWVSLNVTGAEASWSQIGFHGLIGYAASLSDRIRPYVEARYVYRHLRPEDDRYFGGEDRLLRDVRLTGGGPSAALGVELLVNRRFGVDLGGAYGTYGVTPDFSGEGLGPIDAGSVWRAQLGVAWFPTARRGGER